MRFVGLAAVVAIGSIAGSAAAQPALSPPGETPPIAAPRPGEPALF